MATLLRLLTLLAVLTMPLGMIAPASAANHQSSISHCDKMAPRHGSKGNPGECTMACAAALPAFNAVAPEPIRTKGTRTLPGPVERLISLSPEAETPPPRTA